MSIFQQIQELFSQPDQDEIMAFQYKIPGSITVHISKENNVYIAQVEKIDNDDLETSTFLAEAKTPTELVYTVNDMLLTYLDFPDKIKSRMPQLLPPELAAKQLDSLGRHSSKELVFAK